ncbi:hypothetical protein K438DRAFT_1787453 [Mycena galopus ATCC 62051]|nr:hypothetical protein K438DRAFT_1787453 [Mycena galopus ATCC 62051]
MSLTTRLCLVKSRAAKTGKAAAKNPRVIAESASEDEEAVSSEENSNSTDPKSDQSDGEDAHDVSPNEDEFQTEVPHIVSGKSKAADNEEGDNSDVDVEMKSQHGSVHELFNSDNESIEIDKPRVKSKGQARRHDSAHDVIDSDNESIEIDKPRVKAKGKARRQDKSEPDTDDTFPDAPRRVVFIDDSDAEMPASKSGFSHRSGRSSAASWSSGQDLRVPDSDAEEDLPPSILLPPKKKGKSISRKKQAYGQTEELKAVLRGCIEFIKLSLVFEDAYPAIVSRAGFARSYLLSASQGPAAVDIKHRLETDLSFAARLADIPLDRINITRGDFKRFAAQEVPGLYRFAHLPAAEVRTIVTERLQDHRYIFPVDSATNRLKGELPFHHEAIVGVLKKAVFTGQFRTKNLHLFASTSTNHPNRVELPDAMVCLAATAVYGALVEYRATGILQNIPFTEGAYEDIYRNHMRTLSDTRAAAPIALHRVLHKLYNLVTESTAATATATGSSAVLINLVEVPESD